MVTPADLLGRRHQAAQTQLANQVAARLLQLWRGTVLAPGRGTDAFLAQASPLVVARNARSASLATTFYTRARRLEHPGAAPFTPEAEELLEEKVITSLVASGFQELSDSLAAGKTLEQALDAGATAATGAATRHVLSGGRSIIRDAVYRDTVTVGYERVTRPGCCSFCAMLASRGAVYRSDSFDQSDPRFDGEGSKVKVHDECHCDFRIVWKQGQPPTGDAAAYKKLWDDEIKDKYTGHEATKAFRRLYEARFLRPALSSTAAAS